MKILIYLTFVISIFLWGCSDNNPTAAGSGGATGGLGGGDTGGGGNGNVTFQVSSQATQDGYQFSFTPSANITVDKLNVTETTGSNYQEQFQGDGTTVYNAGTQYDLVSLTGAQSQMHFKFELIGKTSPGGQAYDVTTEYTIP
jgi:hypothetical protein